MTQRNVVLIASFGENGLHFTSDWNWPKYDNYPRYIMNVAGDPTEVRLHPKDASKYIQRLALNSLLRF